MTHNPVYSPDSMEATTSLSRVVDKEMQETMVRCIKETKPDVLDKRQCWCWAGGGEGGGYKAALKHNRCHINNYYSHNIPCFLFQGEVVRAALDLCSSCYLAY